MKNKKLPTFEGSQPLLLRSVVFLKAFIYQFILTKKDIVKLVFPDKFRLEPFHK